MDEQQRAVLMETQRQADGEPWARVEDLLKELYLKSLSGEASASDYLNALLLGQIARELRTVNERLEDMWTAEMERPMVPLTPAMIAALRERVEGEMERQAQ